MDARIRRGDELRMKPRHPPAPATVADERLRLDKWLWAARFYRTRSLAAQAIDAGQVRVDDARVKPAQMIRAGSRVSIRKVDLVWNVEVVAIAQRRGSAAAAAALFRESAENVAARAAMLRERSAARAGALARLGRPTKRDRRKLEDFLNEP
jgi:ribosome-associated heat shock protein Hsp15